MMDDATTSCTCCALARAVEVFFREDTPKSVGELYAAYIAYRAACGVDDEKS